jgi:hypothetical protein
MEVRTLVKRSQSLPGCVIGALDVAQAAIASGEANLEYAEAIFKVAH